MVKNSTRNVFINCPFDDGYEDIFRAIVFTVISSGFSVRVAKESDDAGETRIDKIYRLIGESRYSIHDISRTELDSINRLPRFNMPLELGLFLGAKKFGDESHTKKRCLILDIEQYRYQKFVSDLSGMDINTHDGMPIIAVEKTRNWLATNSRRKNIIAPVTLMDSYQKFEIAFPDLVVKSNLNRARLAFPDLERLVVAWVRQSRL